jgi:hypothetical protein
VSFPPVEFYAMTQRPAPVKLSPSLPTQQMWGYDGIVPGPTFVARYGRPILVRNFNQLPSQNGGFGINSVSTHLHNGHTPSESDGFPCDFFDAGRFYDHHYPNVLAGILSTHPGTGDINESLSTLWYHDHPRPRRRTRQGAIGFYILFNDLDTGDEAPDPAAELSGVRHPDGVRGQGLRSDRRDGSIFNLDGVLGDVPPSTARCSRFSRWRCGVPLAMAERRAVALLRAVFTDQSNCRRERSGRFRVTGTFAAAVADESVRPALPSAPTHHRLPSVRREVDRPREPAAANQRRGPTGVICRRARRWRSDTVVAP